jgi:hypothetical protein
MRDDSANEASRGVLHLSRANLPALDGEGPRVRRRQFRPQLCARRWEDQVRTASNARPGVTGRARSRHERPRAIAGFTMACYVERSIFRKSG